MMLLSILALLGSVGSSEVYVRCYNKTFDNYKTAPLESCHEMLVSCINNSRISVFHAFGMDGLPDGRATTKIGTTFLAEGYNMIVVDWSKDAAINPLLGASLTYATSAVPKAKAIGALLGKVLAELANNYNLDGSKFYLTGHSLGSHLVGEAGRNAKIYGLLITIALGLDPPGLLYGPLGNTPINRDSASFVTIIHTDPCGKGTDKNTGHVDFYPNYKPNCPFNQPGCQGNYPVSDLSIPATCNHDFSWKIFCDAIENPQSMPAALAASYEAWVASNGSTTSIAYIGAFNPSVTAGKYYLVTNSAPPYGKGIDGLTPPSS